VRKKSTSSIEVARRAGVSQATVSYVLNKRTDQSISEPTRQRVYQAVRELKYRPNRLADGLLRGKTNTIGVISPFLQSDFHDQVLRGVCEALNLSGYHSYIAWSTMNPQGQLSDVELMLEHRVDGVVWMSDTGPWLRDFLRAEDVKVVVIDDNRLSDEVDCVVSDDISGAKTAVNHLLSLGHRRIGLWSAVWDGSPYRDRVLGYREALDEAGIGVDPVLCRSFPANPRRTAIELYDFLKMPNPPTAIFTTNDIPAMLIKYASEDTGLDVPGDIAITGYSNQDYSEFNDITTVSQNAVDMGRIAARMLSNRINNPGAPPHIEYVPTELIVRGSTVPRQQTGRFDSLDQCIPT